MPKFAKKPVAETDEGAPPVEPVTPASLSQRPGVTINDYVTGQLLDPPQKITPADISDEASEPSLPGFAMSDQPFEGDPSRPPPLDIVEDRSPAQMALDGDILPPTGPYPAPAPTSPARTNGVKYESRISIVEAYQYPGNLSHAPDWIDKNWIGYADFDEFRKIEPGPCLRVPDATGAYIVCRPGDYVARQEVKFTHDLPGEIKIEVWEQQHFQKLFIPRLPGSDSSRLPDQSQD